MVPSIQQQFAFVSYIPRLRADPDWFLISPDYPATKLYDFRSLCICVRHRTLSTRRISALHRTDFTLYSTRALFCVGHLNQEGGNQMDCRSHHLGTSLIAPRVVFLKTMGSRSRILSVAAQCVRIFCRRIFLGCGVTGGAS